MQVVNELDKTLFKDFIYPKSQELITVIRNGILDPRMDWFETPRPTG